MAEAVDLSAKRPWTLVRFVHDGGSKAVTNRDSDFLFSGINYLSEPELQVSLPENDGLFIASPCNIVLPLEADPDFTYRFSNGEPHAPTTVTVTEILKGDAEQITASTNIFTAFKGLCVSARRNFRGRRELVQIQALPLKARLKSVALGLPCNHQCANRLGDAGCKVDLLLSNRTLSAEITSIDGAEVTIDTMLTGLGDRFFQRGYMTFQGLPIGIQDWRDELNGDRLKFFMNRKPPEHWLNETVSIIAGCDKTQETCDGRYGNLVNFLGAGFSIPPYHPNFEDGGCFQ